MSFTRNAVKFVFVYGTFFILVLLVVHSVHFQSLYVEKETLETVRVPVFENKIKKKSISAKDRNILSSSTPTDYKITRKKINKTGE